MLKHRGVAYYPEFWPPKRWPEDIRLMKKAAINIVRIGEFAWTAMEPAEGQFDLDWLHQIVGMMGQADINVLLCTPTATPPAWLTHQYPDTLLVKRDGKRAEHGTRRQYCPTSSAYRRHTGRIVARLGHEFSKYPNVIAWQLDNEFGPEYSYCHCDHCTAKFRVWLRNRYGSLEALNAAWQTRFWSVTYTEWDQIELRLKEGVQTVYPSIELDMRRFFSDCFCDYAAFQTQILRSCGKAMVTTNMMGPIFTPINYYQMAESFDVVCDDLYFDISTMSGDAAACDVFRNMAPEAQGQGPKKTGAQKQTPKQKPFWITETGSGALTEGKGPYADQLRAWMYSAIARGSEAHFIFRWRTCLAGQEQDLQGVIETSGRPRYRYAAVKRMFTEAAALAKQLPPMPPPKAQVAIISSYDSHWAYESCRIGKFVKPIAHLLEMHELCYDRNVPVDIIPPERDFKKHKLIILPSVCIVPGQLAERLEEFVRGGGVVLATPQLGTRDANNNYISRCAPDGLGGLFGLRVESHNYLHNANEADQALWVPAANVADETVGVQLGEMTSGLAGRYMEDIELQGAAVVARYSDNLYAGQPAVTVNQVGKGAAYYVAAYLEAGLFDAVLELAMERAGVESGPQTPKWVEVAQRGQFTFAINHSRQETQIDLPGSKAIVGDWADGRANLPAYGVCVVETK